MLARARVLWNRRARATLEYLRKDEIMLVLSREVGEGIKIGDQIVGGIGVSGGHYSQDMAVAQAGLDALGA